MTDEARKALATKLQKILAKAQGAEELGNAEEAATFTAKAQELMTRYELTLDEVEYAAQQEKDPIHQAYWRARDHNVPSRRRRYQWMESLARAVGRAFFCRTLVLSGSNSQVFVGRKSHTEMACYVYGRLVRNVLRLQVEEDKALYRKTRDEGGSPEEAKEACRGFRPAFRNAFVATVAARVREMRKTQREAAEAMQAESETGTALIRLDRAEKAVDQYMDEKMNIHSAGALRGRYSGNRAGRSKGREHGSRASLSANGVRGGSGGSRALGAGS